MHSIMNFSYTMMETFHKDDMSRSSQNYLHILQLLASDDVLLHQQRDVIVFWAQYSLPIRDPRL
jgi:hypothetical protein